MDSEKTWALCPGCRNNTRCDVLRSYPHSIDDPNFTGSETYTILQCGGCTKIFYMTETTEHHGADYEDSHSYESYPLRVSRYVYIPINPFDLNVSAAEIGQLESEVNTAISSRLYRLAAMGIRTLVMLIVNKATTSQFDSFNPCLDYLFDNGIVTERQREILNQTIELGSSAVHRNHQPDLKQIVAAADIVNLFSTLLLRAEKSVSEIENKLPPDTRKKRRP